MWGLQSCTISSGQFQLTSSEHKSLQKAFIGRDLLFDICGENRVWNLNLQTIKSNSNQRRVLREKSAALNLLMALDVGELHINANGLEELAKLRDKLFHAAIRVYN